MLADLIRLYRKWRLYRKILEERRNMHYFEHQARDALAGWKDSHRRLMAMYELTNDGEEFDGSEGTDRAAFDQYSNRRVLDLDRIAD